MSPLPDVPGTPTASAPSLPQPATRPGAGGAAARAPAGLPAQRSAWADHGERIARVRSGAHVATVREGDTLVGLVRQRWQDAGAPVARDDARLYPAALKLAQAHGLADADRIDPGQRFDLSAVPLPGGTVRPATPRPSPPVAWQADFPLSNPAAFRLRAAASPPVGQPTAARDIAPSGIATARPAATQAAIAVMPAAGAPTAHPLLDRTLDRAVARGYLPAGDQAEVQQRILRLAQRHGFQPDDFARVTLLESDGLNPRASNGQCHGILQFCSGPGRGAASVGLGHDPGRILRMSVREQLELVDRYFDDTGLARLSRQKGGTVGLDDLYLTVLTPAARDVRHPHAALPIAGVQAAALYPGGDRRAPITRQSLLDGLQQHALDRLARQGKRWLQSVGWP